MPIENERKWLIDPNGVDFAVPFPVAISDSHIVQVILRHPDDDIGVTERVRQRTYMTLNAPHKVEYTHTVKRPTKLVGSRIEEEWEIDEEMFEKLLLRRHPDTVILHKSRRVFHWEGHTFELDSFQSPPGLLILECELDSLETPVETPPWLPVLADVTEDATWTNTALARFDRMARIRIRHIAEATKFHSSHEPTREHAEFAKLIAMDKKRLTRLLLTLVDENTEEEGWVPLLALGALYPGDKGALIPEANYGMFVNISQQWLLWGEVLGYR
jgi:CYTH domain-containing protein